jgi:hypothetical protein
MQRNAKAGMSGCDGVSLEAQGGIEPPIKVLQARVSTSDQQIIPMQIRAMREYAALPLGSFCSF